MGKKRSWFSLVKRLFVSEPKSKAEKKSKRWRWVFGGLKPKHYPTLAAPRRIISEAREEQRKHAMAVAIATAAAAEAAVAAARVAAEVVRLTGVPQSFQEYEKWAQNLAATKIQAAYRAHLARKALKALKGLVRLQAMVRGRIARRQVITKLKSLPPTAKTHSQVHEVWIPSPTVDGSCRDSEKRQFLSPKEELEERKLKQLRCNSQKSWDYSLFSKEDMETSWLRKQEATSKRERMKKYSFSNREKIIDENVETLKENGRWSNHLERRLESEACQRREMLKCKSIACSNFLAGDMYRATRMRLRNEPKQDSVELNSPFTHPRRSFCHTKQKSIGDETSLPSSPIFPTYMAATESAKAKARSMSTPKQRLGLLDTYSDHYGSPYKLRLPSWSSLNGEVTSTNRRRGVPEQISLSMNGLY